MVEGVGSRFYLPEQWSQEDELVFDVVHWMSHL